MSVIRQNKIIKDVIGSERLNTFLVKFHHFDNLVSSIHAASQPGGAYPTQPGGAYPSQPAGAYPTQPGGAYPTQPGGAYPTQPAGAMTTTTVITQPAVPVMASVMYGPNPLNLVCPYCQATIVTSINTTPGALPWLLCCGCVLFG